MVWLDRPEDLKELAAWRKKRDEANRHIQNLRLPKGLRPAEKVYNKSAKRKPR